MKYQVVNGFILSFILNGVVKNVVDNFGFFLSKNGFLLFVNGVINGYKILNLNGKRIVIDKIFFKFICSSNYLSNIFQELLFKVFEFKVKGNDVFC